MRRGQTEKGVGQGQAGQGGRGDGVRVVQGVGQAHVGVVAGGLDRHLGPLARDQGRLLHVLLELLHVAFELGPTVLEPANHLERKS